MRPGQVREALQAARRLAELTRDAVTGERELRRHQWYERQRDVQRQARRVERLTAELGIEAEEHCNG